MGSSPSTPRYTRPAKIEECTPFTKISKERGKMKGMQLRRIEISEEEEEKPKRFMDGKMKRRKNEKFKEMEVQVDIGKEKWFKNVEEIKGNLRTDFEEIEKKVHTELPPPPPPQERKSFENSRKIEKRMHSPPIIPSKFLLDGVEVKKIFSEKQNMRNEKILNDQDFQKFKENPNSFLPTGEKNNFSELEKNEKVLRKIKTVPRTSSFQEEDKNSEESEESFFSEKLKKIEKMKKKYEFQKNMIIGSPPLELPPYVFVSGVDRVSNSQKFIEKMTKKNEKNRKLKMERILKGYRENEERVKKEREEENLFEKVKSDNYKYFSKRKNEDIGLKNCEFMSNAAKNENNDKNEKENNKAEYVFRSKRILENFSNESPKVHSRQLKTFMENNNLKIQKEPIKPRKSPKKEEKKQLPPDLPDGMRFFDFENDEKNKNVEERSPNFESKSSDFHEKKKFFKKENFNEVGKSLPAEKQVAPRKSFSEKSDKSENDQKSTKNIKEFIKNKKNEKNKLKNSWYSSESEVDSQNLNGRLLPTFPQSFCKSLKNSFFSKNAKKQIISSQHKLEEKSEEVKEDDGGVSCEWTEPEKAEIIDNFGFFDENQEKNLFGEQITSFQKVDNKKYEKKKPKSYRRKKPFKFESSKNSSKMEKNEIIEFCECCGSPVGGGRGGQRRKNGKEGEGGWEEEERIEKDKKNNHTERDKKIPKQEIHHKSIPDPSFQNLKNIKKPKRQESNQVPSTPKSSRKCCEKIDPAKEENEFFLKIPLEKFEIFGFPKEKLEDLLVNTMERVLAHYSNFYCELL